MPPMSAATIFFNLTTKNLLITLEVNKLKFVFKIIRVSYYQTKRIDSFVAEGSNFYKLSQFLFIKEPQPITLILIRKERRATASSPDR